MSVWNHIAARLFHGRDYWHNRHFDRRYCARRETWDRWSVMWNGQPVPHRSVSELAALNHPALCHIIASGPSLARLRDPARLFTDFTICMNGSFRLAQQAGKTCDLYLVNDAGFIRRRWVDFRAGIAQSRHQLLDHLMLFFLLERDATLAFGLNPFLNDDPNRPHLTTARKRRAEIAKAFQAGEDFIPHPRRARIWMTRNPALGIARATSVVCAALQAAWLMRFAEVRIYGMDLGGAARFYQERSQAEPSGLDRAYETALLPWFREFATRFCGPEFRVFNCSDSSRLPAEVLPRRDPNAP